MQLVKCSPAGLPDWRIKINRGSGPDSACAACVLHTLLIVRTVRFSPNCVKRDLWTQQRARGLWQTLTAGRGWQEKQRSCWTATAVGCVCRDCPCITHCDSSCGTVRQFCGAEMAKPSLVHQSLCLRCVRLERRCCSWCVRIDGALLGVLPKCQCCWRMQTNNSTASRAGYVQKMAKLGIPATEDEIVSSSFAAAQYIKVQGLPEGKPLVYVIGERGVLEELALAGFEAIGPEDSGLPPEAAPASREEVDGRVGAVVVGMDKCVLCCCAAAQHAHCATHRYMSYVKLAKASCFVRYNDGCLFVATNPCARVRAPRLRLRLLAHPGVCAPAT